jgi:RHS repeat-associated protein
MASPRLLARSLSRNLIVLNRILLVIALSILACHALAAGQYCGTRSSQQVPSNACFDTFEEAERFIREDTSPPRGRFLLEQELDGLVNAGTNGFSVGYRIPRTGGEFVRGEYEMWHVGLGGNGCPQPYSCASEAESAQRTLARFPHLHSGEYRNSYGNNPPFLWDTQIDSECIAPIERCYLRVPRNLGSTGGTRDFIAYSASGSVTFNCGRADFYKCPNYYHAAGADGTPGRLFSEACHSPERGSILFKPSQYLACDNVGNPCVPATGAKELAEHDFTWQHLTFSRHYTSLGELPLASGLGSHWSHLFAQQLIATTSATADVIWIDDKGNYERFKHVANGRFASSNQVGIVLQKQPVGAPDTWILKRPSDDELGFDATGRLRRIGQHASQISLDYCEVAEANAGLCPIPHVLSSATHANGRTLHFVHEQIEYSPPGTSHETARAIMLVAVRSDEDELVAYHYDDHARLGAAEYADSGASTLYLYAEPQHLCKAADGSAVAGCDATLYSDRLTGVIDESGQRLATYTYGTGGRVTRSEHARGAGRVTLDYLANGDVSVATPQGASTLYQFSTGAFRKPLAIVQQGTPAYTTQTSYLAGTFRPGHRINARGYRTGYGYGPYGETSRTEGLTSAGATTPQTRRIETDPHPTWSLPMERRTYNAGNTLVAKQTWTYTPRGQIQTASQIDPVTAATRTTATSYCEQADVDAPGSTCPILGLRKAIDGPRVDVNDIVSFQYYPNHDESGCEASGPCHRRGDLWRTVNASGQVTENVRYDRAGRLVRQRAADGTLTDFEYHPRGWLARRIVRARGDGVPDASDAVTRFDYAPTGLVERITQPDGDYLDYSYDEAHRLDGIFDALGNHIVYTLDAAGNRIREEISDSGNVLRRRLAREHDSLGRLFRERDAMIDAANPNGRLVAEHGYDGNANRTQTVDGLGQQTNHEYDPLDRLKRSLDALSPRGTTQFEYDARDNLIKVTDPKGLLTEYVYDGLGDLRELRSPDTGTAVHLYDDAGNRVEQTDARGVVTQYDYDALNRLTAIRYPSSPTYNVSFTYDQPFPECGLAAVHGTGRLTQTTDPSGTTLYCHDHRGNVTDRIWNDGIGDPLVTQYRYTRGDRLAAITYPSGREVEWVHDAAGRIGSVRSRSNSGAAWQNLVTTVTYYPFGPISGLSFGNGRSLAKTYDTNYAISSIASSHPDGLDLGFEVDVLGQIRVITPSPGGSGDDERHYSYDPVGRLTAVRDANQALIEGYGYDATGNRLQKQTATGTETYVYPPTSHRLSSAGLDTRLYDNSGNLSSLLLGTSSTTFGYGPNNRYDRLTLDQTLEAEYTHNSQGERACKWLSGEPTRFVYGPGGQLLGEYGANSKVIAEYVYLDSLPVAAVIGGRTVLVETDHLGTPRVVVDYSENEVLWRWTLTGSAFGEHPAEEDADGNGKPLAFPLRFPGQYLDAESGLHYNYFRDYDPVTARYVQSDPIGLGDGLSTYAYVAASPLSFVDLMGLARSDVQCCKDTPRSPNVSASGHGGFISCCEGRRVICVDLNPADGSEANAIFLTCNQQHEDEHNNDPIVMCPSCTDPPVAAGVPAMPDRSPGIENPLLMGTECLAYRRSLRCLQNSLNRCGRDQGCRNTVQGRIRQQINFLNTKGCA